MLRSTRIPQTFQGLLPSSASTAASAQVCTTSSGTPSEDKELIISNYKLGSEHYGPCQGSKLMYLHCTGLWGSPKCPGRGEEVAARGSTWQFKDWGHCCPSKCKIPLGKQGETLEMGSVKGAISTARCSTWDCIASSLSETAVLPKPHQHLCTRREQLLAGTRLESCWNHTGTTLGPHWDHAGTCHSWQSCCCSLLRGPAQHWHLCPAFLPSCPGSSAAAPTGRRCLSSP